MPIPTELPEINFDDPVDMAILEAQLRFEKGQDLYKQGSLKRAKDEFNAAIDLILDTAASHPKELRLQRELMNVVARVNAIELGRPPRRGRVDRPDRPARSH